MKSICVYCGSSTGKLSEYSSAARELGRLLVSSGIELIYGGGRVGLMGVVADAVLEAGGSVQGVIPHSLAEKEVAHRSLTHLHVVDTMHQRKAMMAELSDGFIAMPGGIGTFEELFEIWTWAQLGIHSKPIGLLNVAGYFEDLLRFLDHAVNEQLLKPVHRSCVDVDENPRSLLQKMQTRHPNHQEHQWIDSSQT